MTEVFISSFAGTLLAISLVLLGIVAGKRMIKEAPKAMGTKRNSLFDRSHEEEATVFRHSDEAYDEEMTRKEKAGDG